MPEDIVDQARTFLPKYLSPEEQRDLYEELRDFPEVGSLYTRRDLSDYELLQGDGWEGFIVRRFEDGDRKRVDGLIISNSCDISPDNSRNLGTRVLFSPLIEVSRYERLLREESGMSDEAIDSHLENARKQRVTRIFHLPSGQDGPAESIAYLDNIHTHPLDHFLETDRGRLFRLSQLGHYLLLLKLSIHFSRFLEDVPRGS